jgi:hypothetical protein
MVGIHIPQSSACARPLNLLLFVRFPLQNTARGFDWYEIVIEVSIVLWSPPVAPGMVFIRRGDLDEDSFMIIS